MAAPGHCVDVFLTVFIETVDGLQQFFRRQLFFLQHHAVALFLEGTGIQNLVAAAGVGRQGDQQVGLCKCADFTDCIGAGTGDDKVRQGKKIRQFLLIYSYCT